MDNLSIHKILLAALAHRRPYRNTLLQRVLCGRDLWAGFGEGTKFLVIAGVIVFLMITFVGAGYEVMLLDKDRQAVMCLVSFFVLGLMLMMALLSRWSGARLDGPAMRQVSQWLHEEQELADLCTRWWPEHEPLRRRDWYRIVWTRRLLRHWPENAGPTLGHAWRHHVIQCKQAHAQRHMQSRRALDTLAMVHGSWRQQPRPALPSDCPQVLARKVEKTQTTRTATFNASCWSKGALYAVLLREQNRTPKAQEVKWLFAMLLFLLAYGAMVPQAWWFLGIMLGVAVVFWVAVASPRAWGMRWAPPSTGSIQALDAACHQNPLVAWTWIQRCPDPSTVRQADVNAVLALDAALNKFAAACADELDLVRGHARLYRKVQETGV